MFANQTSTESTERQFFFVLNSIQSQNVFAFNYIAFFSFLYEKKKKQLNFYSKDQSRLNDYIWMQLQWNWVNFQFRMLVIELHVNFAPWDAVSWYTKFIWINSIKIKINPDLMEETWSSISWNKSSYHYKMTNDACKWQLLLWYYIAIFSQQFNFSIGIVYIYACSIKSRTLNFNRNFHAHKLNDHYTIDKFGIATFDWHNSRPRNINQYFLEKKWSMNAS